MLIVLLDDPLDGHVGRPARARYVWSFHVRASRDTKKEATSSYWPLWFANST